MNHRIPTQESFLRDVANHVMTIRHDDNLFRNIRFQQPNTCNLYFDITTWPGYLCMSGDAGCYVFSRLPDMFEFFRREDWSGDRIFINPGYWSEKVEAVDRCSEVVEFSSETFIDEVCRWVDEAEASQEVRRAVVEDILPYAHDGEHAAITAAMEFEHEGFRFNDFYEVDCKEYSYRFIWCCYAIAWAVQQWDKVKAIEETGKSKESAA